MRRVWRKKTKGSALFEVMSRGLQVYGISGLVVEYIVAIDVTRVRFPADASLSAFHHQSSSLLLRHDSIEVCSGCALRR